MSPSRREHRLLDIITGTRGEKRFMSHSMRAWRAAPVLALMMALAAGCGGSDGLDTAAGSSPSPSAATASEGPAATPAVSSTPSTSTALDANAAAQEAVRTDFRLYQTAFSKALFTQSAHVPDLVHFATAQKQASDRGRVADLKQQGLVYKGTPKNWLGPVSVIGNRATVQLCEKDNASWYEYRASGKVAGTKLNRWNAFEARLLFREGRWQTDIIAASKTVSCKAAT
jgi:hypothetical protein